MKKQINLAMKAHLIRGAFYLLLLLAVCAIPLALAQRSAAKRGVPNLASNSNLLVSQFNADTRLLPYDVRPLRTSQFPQTTGARAAHVLPIPRPPKAPQDILYQQVRRGTWSQSMPMAPTSSAPREFALVPRIGMSSFTLIMGVFLARKFTAL